MILILLILFVFIFSWFCLLYTSDAADEEDSVDLGCRRIINKKTSIHSIYIYYK
ncbi:hypothetical protein MUDAN_IGPPGNFN_03655 [Lactiplantibacillus mudanjiangensis]|nr:hypothetical protein MUDAN_IGPPGNFN_03655 [Lactiplantibacillus mudanjiangensis]